MNRYLLLSVFSGGLVLSGCRSLPDSVMAPSLRQSVDLRLTVCEPCSDPCDVAADPHIEDHVMWGY